MGRDERKLLHAGELEAQARFDAEPAWDQESAQGMILDTLSPSLASFISSQPFFFMATSNARGDCDCSFRGREYGSSGKPLPLLKVLDGKTLVFPDYQGNGLYNSLGNILSNPHIGLLFVDFQRRSRFRVNGRVEIIEDQLVYADIWPLAQRYLLVTVEQAYANCRSRIPRMVMVEPSDTFLHE